MSIRNQLLQEIHSDKGCTLADLMDGTGFDRKRLHDNLKAAIDDGLLQRTKDEITGQPFYTLTELGAERLAAGPAKNIKRPTQAGSGANNPGSSASVPSSEVSHPAEGAAVETLPGGKGTPDPAADEIKPPQYDPRKVSFNPSDRALSIAIRNHNLIDEICTLENLSAFIADRISSSTALKQKDDELFKQAQIVANLRREVESLTAALNQAKRRQTSGVGDKYMLMYPDDKLFNTQEQAAASATQSLSESEIEDAQIIAVNPIGRIEVRTVFVPHADNYQEAA
jgi:DNA-binding MarR family transcriptional regulator